MPIINIVAQTMYVSLNETMSVFSDELTQEEENHHTHESTNHVLIRE